MNFVRSTSIIRTILHITPHLGGGVGKALSSLVEQATLGGREFRHEILCLERPEKSQFVERVAAAGCRLIVCPEPAELEAEIAAADIVQLEFWNHPALLRLLCSIPLPPMRLCVWCHVSGLAYPCIPSQLLIAAQRFVFTSACSLAAPAVQQLPAGQATPNLGVISSGGGLEHLPLPREQAAPRPFQAGYFGSLNFAKLHPDFVNFLAAVELPHFSVQLIGDETNRALLTEQCQRIGRPDLLDFRGYATDIASALADIDVLIYLLHPQHYGTAENALLEAMAMGIVPVVFDNLAERCIVEHGQTGLVVCSAQELAAGLYWLAEEPEKRLAMGQRAAAAVRERFTAAKMIDQWMAYYADLLPVPKRTHCFGDIFGSQPADWFRSFLPDRDCFTDGGEVLCPPHAVPPAWLEKTKGSVYHFVQQFPEDPRLQQWAEKLDLLAVNPRSVIGSASISREIL